jgi:signal transduction histidine kinase
MFIKKKYPSIFLLLFFVISCSKDTVKKLAPGSNDSVLDSIYKIALNKSSDTSIRLKALDTLMFYSQQRDDLSYQYKALMFKTSMLSRSDVHKAIFFSNELKELAERNQDTLYVGKALLKLGLYSRKKNKNQESFNFYNQASVKFKQIKDSSSVSKSLLEMSKIQRNLGDFTGSKTTIVDGLKYLTDGIKKNTRVGFYQNIAVALREEGDFEKALRYNKEASQYFISEYYSRVLKNTKANLLADQENYDEAILILDSLEKKVTNKNSSEYSRIIDNLGYINWKKDSLNEISKQLLIDAQEIKSQNNDVKGLVASNMHLAEFYFNINPDMSINYAEEALVNATKINSMVSQLEALDYIIKLKDNPKQEALSYTKIDENLKKINQNNRELYAVTKYENEKILKEKSIIEADRLKKQKLNSWYLFGLITLFFVAAFIVIILKNRHTKAQNQKILDTEKRISKRIHDELANDVYSSMVQLENNTASVAQVVNNLEDIYHKARDLSQEKSAIRSNSEFIDDLKKVLASFKTEEINVIVKGLITDIWIDVSNEKKLTVDRVIKELLVNMRKHSSANLVSVIFSRKKNVIRIGYTDNGIGNHKNEISKGVGLVNAENRIEAIGGSFIFDKSITNGFKISIEIPV